MVVNTSLIYDFLDCNDFIKTLFILFCDSYDTIQKANKNISN